ncbi:EscU/YscU/HrcU family type III secretion system export apparatus switch protein [Alphaproteobacteria bacterium]|nr:EscU/YscU/HrcU family type III secretion system export apparatus switch protein [Alphaproteobacteria bacterium]
MAEESEDGQEKTEEPSQRKLDKAAEDGKVLTSKEMFVFTSVGMGLVMLLGVTQVVPQILGIWGEMFRFDTAHDIRGFGLPKLKDGFFLVIMVTIIVGIPLLLVSLLTQAAVGGINFAPKSMEFKGNRISLLAGLKRMFSSKGLVELAKAILKVASLFGIAAWVIYVNLPSLVFLTGSTLGGALSEISNVFPLMIGAMLVALMVIAAIDYAWQQHTHTKSLKMTLKEVKDEYKQTEGSPEVKAKIRRMQMQQAAEGGRQRDALENVASATTVITNPTHFAVALKYEAGTVGAPTVVAMGKGKMAEQIIERASDAKVRVLRIPLLARALYFTSNIGGEISESLYNAVAIILAYVYRIDRGDVLEEPEINLPPEMHFDEHGKVEGDE